MKTTLLLWDIDGTLIASGGAGMLALQLGLRDGLGIDGSLDDIDFAGRTDRWIARRIFEKFSVPHTEENFTRLIDGYVAALPAALANPRARVLPGVRELLAAVAEKKAAMQRFPAKRTVLSASSAVWYFSRTFSVVPASPAS